MMIIRKLMEFVGILVTVDVTWISIEELTTGTHEVRLVDSIIGMILSVLIFRELNKEDNNG